MKNPLATPVPEAAEPEAPEEAAPVTAGPSFRRLGRNTLIYSAGVFVQRIISVLMLPIYTRVMTPADYGVLDLLQMVTDITALVLTAGLTAGLQRVLLPGRRLATRRNAIVSTAFLMQLGLALRGHGRAARPRRSHRRERPRRIGHAAHGAHRGPQLLARHAGGGAAHADADRGAAARCISR